MFLYAYHTFSYHYCIFFFLEIEVRQDMKLESDMKLEKLESFLGRLNGKG